ncbi:MAG: hypothetical protein V7605_1569 [Acidimicrobiaceae bacterium]
MRAPGSGTSRRDRSVATAVVAIAVSLLVSCSGKSSSQPRRPLDTSVAPGSSVVSDDAEGFAVSFPTTWVKLPTDIGSFDAAAGSVKASAPPSAASAVATGLLQLKSVVREGAALAAIDPTTGATANLVTLGAQGQKPSEVAIGAANQLIGNGATEVTRQNVTVDGVTAVRQRFKTPFPGDAGPVSLSESQLYAVRRGQVFILTLAGESPDLDAIAGSLKLA